MEVAPNDKATVVVTVPAVWIKEGVVIAVLVVSEPEVTVKVDDTLMVPEFNTHVVLAVCVQVLQLIVPILFNVLDPLIFISPELVKLYPARLKVPPLW